MIEERLLPPGFIPDPDNPNAGYLPDSSGRLIHVFLKRSRKPERHQTEMAALGMISQHAVSLPVPRLIGEIPGETHPVCILSYEEGVNLSDILTPAPHAPPPPPWYQPARLPSLPSMDDLLPLFREVGRAVRALHSIHLEQFGKIAGFEPNPFRQNARAFTFQEFAHAVQVGLEKEIFTPALAQAVEDWAAREAGCLSETEPACLVHFDLHAHNIRVCADPFSGTWRLRCLYDFEIARGWLPEVDLAYLQWDLKDSSEDGGPAWHSFMEGYGPIDPARLRLFSVLSALFAAAYGDRYPLWGDWGLSRLVSIIP